MKTSLKVLLHLGYWVCYCLLTVTSLVLITRATNRQITMHDLFVADFFLKVLAYFVVLPALLGFYAHYYLLFPRLLVQRQYLALGLLIPVVALGAALVSGLLFSAASRWDVMFNDGWSSFWGETITMALIAFLNGMVALVLAGFIRYFAEAQAREALVAKNAEMELELLRAQINPHFLFNTINNIDVLIEKAPAQASGYLNRLSDILRYMLYETQAEQISLAQEVAHIEKYLDLHRIRYAEPDFVRFTLEGDVNGAQVAPMLFMPFIENAFKHSENRRAAQGIDVRFRVGQGKVHFRCANFLGEREARLPARGGLGNGLIRKRLALLYPGSHLLEVSERDNLYTVELTIPAQHEHPVSLVPPFQKPNTQN